MGFFRKLFALTVVLPYSARGGITLARNAQSVQKCYRNVSPALAEHTVKLFVFMISTMEPKMPEYYGPVGVFLE